MQFEPCCRWIYCVCVFFSSIFHGILYDFNWNSEKCVPCYIISYDKKFTQAIIRKKRERIKTTTATNTQLLRYIPALCFESYFSVFTNHKLYFDVLWYFIDVKTSSLNTVPSFLNDTFREEKKGVVAK